MLNDEPAPALPEATAAKAPRGRKPGSKGVVDAAPRKPGRKPAAKATRRRGDGGVREL